jgi:phage-related protein
VAEIVKIAPAIAQSLVKIASTLLDAIVQLSPKIAEAIAALVVLLAQVLTENVPKLAEAGFGLVIGLLTAIRDGMPRVVDLATDIVVAFLGGLSKNAPRLAKAGAETLAKFLSGINAHLDKVVDGVAKIVVTFLKAVTSHIPDIVKSGVGMILTFLKQILLSVPRFLRAGVSVILAFLDGIQDAIPRLAKKALSVARTFMNTMADSLVGLVDIGFKAIIRFLHGIANSIRTNRRDLFEAGLDIAKAIVEGIVEGLGWVAQKVIRPIIDKLFSWLPDKIKKMLGIHSPSKIFAEIGENVMLGFAMGLEDGGSTVQDTMVRSAQDVLDTAAKEFAAIPDLLDGIVDMEPVITPVLDLSNVEKDAKKIGELADVVPISAAASFDQASAISVPTAAEADTTAQAGSTFEFNQYNTSPDKLSEIEIYRQTKNQLGQVKSVLGLAT